MQYFNTAGVFIGKWGTGGKPRVKTTRNSHVIKGTAGDADSTVATVQVKAGKTFKPAKGTTNWMFKACLHPSRTRFLVTATDFEGGTSTQAMVRVTRR